ncbi:hypothetical protein ES332_A03G051500v1 [Gossypium tomentosum]|uniref:Uncharacterized protein n=1 Tax=Gossypium tomentosum TaxID=34277 RepID=A0A5D2R2K0_GOSTO|nr:hypothetical protein ES332_A03G051500v1 [Gossypium tomentosum]
MASTCISTCIYDIKVPIRPTNAYKWPESDAEFVRSLSSNGGSRGGHAHPTVVDSISCRQMYLRSYKFHRSDDHQTEPEQTKCFGTVKMEKKTKCVALKRAKVVSCAALLAVFRRLLFCTTKVDVADHGG